MSNIFINDEKEFLKQKEQYIYDSKKYIEAKFLIGSGDTMPISKVYGESVNKEDIARLICAMNEQIVYLAKQCPEAIIIANHMKSQSYGAIQKFEKKEKDSDE